MVPVKVKEVECAIRWGHGDRVLEGRDGPVWDLGEMELKP